MTGKTIYKNNGIPWEWPTTEEEARHWRQFTIEELRGIAARRSGASLEDLEAHSRRVIIALIEGTIAA